MRRILGLMIASTCLALTTPAFAGALPLDTERIATADSSQGIHHTITTNRSGAGDIAALLGSSIANAVARDTESIASATDPVKNLANTSIGGRDHFGAG